jgi:hypothetical protein
MFNGVYQSNEAVQKELLQIRAGCHQVHPKQVKFTTPTSGAKTFLKVGDLLTQQIRVNTESNHPKDKQTSVIR